MDLLPFIKARETAVRAQNIGAVTEFYDPQVIFFDVVHDLQYQGIAALRKRLEEWWGTLATLIDFEIKVLHSAQVQEMAWCATLNHIVAETVQGSTLDMWWRETACYTFSSGKWVILHAHSSVPFDTESGKASLELKP